MTQMMPTEVRDGKYRLAPIWTSMLRLTVLLGVFGSGALVTGFAHTTGGTTMLSRSPRAHETAAVRHFSDRLDSLRKAAHIAGMSVVILRDTTVLLASGYGAADVERQVPATPETPYNIASVTKPLSAVVALRLVERGQLDLDRPMSTYDGFAEFCRSARAEGGLFFRDYACDDPVLTLRHVLSMTANGTPGTRFFYNPPSYSWASRPMMQVTKQSFSKLTAEYVFQPAGMKKSARIHRQLPLPPDIGSALAKPYHLDHAGKLAASDPPPAQGDGAAGGVISTVMDLARFDIALAQGKLLTAASRKAMWTPTRSPSGAKLPYGIGWYVQEYRGETLLWHSGWWEGAYSAIYLKVPHRHLTIILLANTEGLWWNNPLDGAEVQRSPFVAAFLEAFPR
jgi:CubicO group peptidase (beta-lactamase class C family)